jgi:N-alpha-acetyltransferase 15/16, NatA auxiliary subunit
LAKSYLVSALRKGIPSLFSEIKSLYADPQKQRVIEDLVEDFRSALAPDAVPTDPPSEFSPTTECPTTYLWTLYFLAQHHSFLSRPLRAQEVLSMALEHTPTLPELHACQGRILKRAGDFIGAARSMDQARLLDGQDRFLNTKCAKYQLRAGMIEEANELLGLFVKVLFYFFLTSTSCDTASDHPSLRKMQQVQELISKTCNPFYTSSRTATRTIGVAT